LSDSDDRVVWISGGAGGIGLATANRFLAEGSRVVLTDLESPSLAEAERMLAAGGSPLTTLGCDVTRISDIEATIVRIRVQFGRLDVLVNAAGIWVEGNSADTTEAEWDRVIAVNLKGTFFTCSRAIHELIKTRGCIVNISSDAGLWGNSEAAIYCASKGGVTILSKALAVELAPLGVRVNVVCPGDVMTPMLEGQAATYGHGNPQGYYDRLLAAYPQGRAARFTRPEEVAEAVYFLASPRVEAVTGAALSVDFGLTAGY
jgi:NAD(P)-dependent dehydrogenase (short-subunit alcohol dehydrogenase family)